ncbi:MAG TPA: ABC transporter ATP-binding protein [Alphaproteobacteria bacterium]|nr:ABC transporter ATP-binding protein [Alphaproteobacteria bacterium]
MTLLAVSDLGVRYGAISALREVSMQIDAGERVALIGANGAGKSTLLKAIMGLLPAADGCIEFAGAPMSGLSVERRAALGIGYAPEGRRVFAGMSVRENLEVACPAGAPERRRRIDEAFALFPRLATRARANAWRLSGGEQQMLAIARALMGAPKLLLLDEPTLGLAAGLRAELGVRLASIAEAGTAVLLAEQSIAFGLGFAERAYVMRTGAIVKEGMSGDLRGDSSLTAAFLGA